MRSNAARIASLKARHLSRTGAGISQFTFKTLHLGFETRHGVLRMEHGLGDVLAKGADNAEPVTGARPCPRQ